MPILFPFHLSCNIVCCSIKKYYIIVTYHLLSNIPFIMWMNIFLGNKVMVHAYFVFSLKLF